ncbi:MAG: glycosyltransferase family 2 protein [Gemmatimonadetes bacterium]|nr:glycosyltransferase family 2 protein [Gemmatimonadota bacterium]
MKLSLVVPVYNEARHLEAVVHGLLRAPCPVEREFVFVDDASTDGSLAILERLAGLCPAMRVLQQPRNRGKGAAAIRGFREATGDIVMIQDADFEYDPLDIPSLLEPILAGKADVVYGSRFKKSTPQTHRTYHYFVNRFLTTVSNMLSGLYLTDMETCYKVFRAPLVQGMQLRSQRFGIEVELTAYVAKTRARVHELPIAYYPRTQLQGKKINWRDGVAALWHLVHFNLLTSVDRAFRVPPDTLLPTPGHWGRTPAMGVEALEAADRPDYRGRVTAPGRDLVR